GPNATSSTPPAAALRTRRSRSSPAARRDGAVSSSSCGLRNAGGVELHGIPGELHVRLLERGPVRAQLGEGQSLGAEQLGDTLAVEAVHREDVLAGHGDPGARIRERGHRLGAPRRPHVDASTPPPGAGVTSARALVAAISRPRPMTIRWSAASSSSLMRWLETSTVRP